MLKRTKVAIFSDLHLGLYSNSLEWHAIALSWADWIVKDLKSKGVKDILFLGDFFHNRSEISVQTVHVASEIIGKFKDFNLFMIVGNHDAFYKNRADIHSLGLLKGHDNITIIDKPLVLDVFDKKMLFVPWNCAIPDENFDYIFGHFEIQSFKMNNYKTCDHGLQVLELLNKTDTVFSGHFHHRNTKTYNEGKVHYVGNTFPMDFSDVGNVKGYDILDIETGELEFFENKVSPRFVKFNLSALAKITEADIKGNIVKMVVDKDVPDDKLEKFKVYVNKFSPHQLNLEFNVVSKDNSGIEELDAIDLEEMLDEFVIQLKLEEDKQLRVDGIIVNLYDRSK